MSTGAMVILPRWPAVGTGKRAGGYPGVVRIVVSGSSGLIGTALCARLRGANHTVLRLVRRPARNGDELQWDPQRGKLPAGALDGADAVVNLGGAGIGNKRWTKRYIALVRDSRVRATELLAETIAAAERPVPVMISGSAVGIYGDRGDEVLDESSPAGSGVLSDICTAWEAATAPAAQRGVRVAHLRTGIVLASHGGALRKQLPLFRAGLGGHFGSGRQYQSWITLTDAVGAIVHLLTADARGPVNVTAPEPVTNAEFTRALADALHRKAKVAVPAFALRAALGGQMADELLLASQRVYPRALMAGGYTFAHPAIHGALRAVLDRGAVRP